MTSSGKGNPNQKTITLGLTGDFMIGRGVDQIFPYHTSGTLYEGFMKHAKQYVDLAERENGPIPMDEVNEKGNQYVWGDLLDKGETIENVDCLILNLETTLTTHSEPEPFKGINYQAHPINVRCISAARTDHRQVVVTLANNHILDWQEKGLLDTLITLVKEGIPHTGAGRDRKEATCPVTIKITSSDQSTQIPLKIAAVGFENAGVPAKWGASFFSPGVYYEFQPTDEAAIRLAKTLSSDPSNKNALKIVSLHWGPNWGWGVPDHFRGFARKLVDLGVDIVAGHSSHHVKGLEVYKSKLIAYGLGDFLNDYEGIKGQGYEAFRDDLTCLYLPKLDIETGNLIDLTIVPCKIRHLKVQRASSDSDIEWLCNTITREGRSLGTSCQIVEHENGQKNLRLLWN